MGLVMDWLHNPEFLSRIRFGFNAMFHIPWPPLNIGLALVLFALEAAWVKTRQPFYYHEGSRTLTTPPASESNRSVARPATPAMTRSEVDPNIGAWPKGHRTRWQFPCCLTPCDRHVL